MLTAEGSLLLRIADGTGRGWHRDRGRGRGRHDDSSGDLSVAGVAASGGTDDRGVGSRGDTKRCDSPPDPRQLSVGNAKKFHFSTITQELEHLYGCAYKQVSISMANGDPHRHPVHFGLRPYLRRWRRPVAVCQICMQVFLQMVFPLSPLTCHPFSAPFSNT